MGRGGMGRVDGRRTFVALHDDPDAGPDALVDEFCGLSVSR